MVCRSESRHRFSPDAATDFIGIGFRVIIDSASSSNANDHIENLFEQAEKDDVRAKFKVGLLYEEGEFLPQSTSTAVAWDRKAEEQGLVAAKLIDTAIESFSTPGNAYDSYFENNT